MEVLPLIVGAACGFLSACGVGGGSLLMVWLTAFAGFQTEEAAMMNLVFFLPSALGGLFFHCRRHLVEKKVLLPSISAGCVCAALGVWLSNVISPDFLRPMYGLFLLFAGILEIKKSRGK